MRRLLGPGPRFVLTIGNEGALLAYIVDGRAAEVCQVADTGKASLAALGAALARRPSRPLVVLIDLLEQSYRQESAPKVSRTDRRKVLKRRLERAFPDAALKAAIERGDDPGHRSSKRYLLAAVPAVPDWARWADLLRTIGNPIVALTLLPVEAVSMVARLTHHLAPPGSPPSPWAILISRQATGGVRQIVVNRGELALTRLTPTLAPATPGDAPELPASDGARPQDPAGRPPESDAASGPSAQGTLDLAAALRDELSATLSYMTRLGYRADAGLDVIVLGDEGLKRHWEDAIPNGCRLHALTATDAATALGLGQVPDADEGTLLCAAWTARRSHPAVQLLPPDLRLRMLQGLALRSASTSLAASAIGLAGYTVFLLMTGLQLGQEVDWLEAWRTTAETRAERAGPEVSDAEPSADTVHAVLEANQRLQRGKLDPIVPLQALRRAMARDEQLLSVVWQTDSGNDAGRPARGDQSERQESDDFVLDLTLDLGRGPDRSAAVAAADHFAARLADSFPERPIMIRRQAASILPNESFVGGAGLVAEPLVDAEMSAELRIGRRTR